MSFYSDVIVPSPNFSSIVECRDLNMLEPVTRSAVQSILSDAQKMGITLLTTETYRSPARQKQLFDQKATRLQNVGVHGYGLACDFCKIVDGVVSWAGDWSFLRDLAEKHGLISGLDWGHPEKSHDFVDPDHVQRVSLEDETRLWTSSWYPDASYLPRLGPVTLT